MKPTDKEVAALLRVLREYVEASPARTGGAAYIKTATLREVDRTADALDPLVR